MIVGFETDRGTDYYSFARQGPKKVRLLGRSVDFVVANGEGTPQDVFALAMKARIVLPTRVAA